MVNRNSVFYGLIAVMGFLLLAPIILDIKQELEYQDDNKQLEILKSTVTGYEKGSLSWKIFADYIWTGRSPYLFKMEGVNHGVLLDSSGKIVVDSLFADFLKVNTKSKTLTGYDHISARFLKRKETHQKGLIASEDEKSILIKSDELRHYSVSKRTYLYNNVSITQEDSVIRPRNGVEVDNDRNIAYIDGGFEMTSDEFEVMADSMKIFIDDDYSIMKDNVEMIRRGAVTSNMSLDERERRLREKDVTLTCHMMTYSSADDNTIIHVTGNIRIVQEGKEITADTATYDKEKNYYELAGHVVIKSETISWLLTQETQANFNNEDIKDSINQPITISTDKLVFNADAKQIKCIGNVRIVQSDKEISCKQFTYDDESQLVILEGRVNVVKDGENKIETERLTLNLESEEFYAGIGVLTEFKINKNK